LKAAGESSRQLHDEWRMNTVMRPHRTHQSVCGSNRSRPTAEVLLVSEAEAEELELADWVDDAVCTGGAGP